MNEAPSNCGIFSPSAMHVYIDFSLLHHDCLPQYRQLRAISMTNHCDDSSYSDYVIIVIQDSFVVIAGGNSGEKSDDNRKELRHHPRRWIIH